MIEIIAVHGVFGVLHCVHFFMYYSMLFFAVNDGTAVVFIMWVSFLWCGCNIYPITVVVALIIPLIALTCAL